MKSCLEEWLALEQAIEEGLDEESDAYKEAWGRYHWCWKSHIDARASHSAKAEIRRMEMQEFLREWWEKMFEHINFPPKPDPYCDDRTKKFREVLFGKSDNMMVFSKSIARAFKATGIKLNDDETFECMINIRKKPTLSLSKHKKSSLFFKPDISAGKRKPPFPINYIMDPREMKTLIELIEKEWR